MVGLHDLGGLFQPWWFYDSMNTHHPFRTKQKTDCCSSFFLLFSEANSVVEICLAFYLAGTFSCTHSSPKPQELIHQLSKMLVREQLYSSEHCAPCSLLSLFSGHWIPEIQWGRGLFLTSDMADLSFWSPTWTKGQSTPCLLPSTCCTWPPPSQHWHL